MTELKNVVDGLKSLRGSIDAAEGRLSSVVLTLVGPIPEQCLNESKPAAPGGALADLEASLRRIEQVHQRIEQLEHIVGRDARNQDVPKIATGAPGRY